MFYLLIKLIKLFNVYLGEKEIKYRHLFMANKLPGSRQRLIKFLGLQHMYKGNEGTRV